MGVSGSLASFLPRATTFVGTAGCESANWKRRIQRGTQQNAIGPLCFCTLRSTAMQTTVAMKCEISIARTCLISITFSIHTHDLEDGINQSESARPHIRSQSRRLSASQQLKPEVRSCLARVRRTYATSGRRFTALGTADAGTQAALVPGGEVAHSPHR